MKQYISQTETYDLEDKDYLLITAIDNLTKAINKLRVAQNG